MKALNPGGSYDSVLILLQLTVSACVDPVLDAVHHEMVNACHTFKATVDSACFRLSISVPSS
jgi:hypothetical protein